MLFVCVSFPWLRIIKAVPGRDPRLNENTPDMPRRRSIGSGGIGPVAEFILESRGNRYHPGAPESNLAPRTARDQASWGSFVFSTRWRSDFITIFFSSAKTGAGSAKSCTRSALSMGDIASDIAILKTSSPNTQETETFIRRMNPDLVLARCKVLLKEGVFFDCG
jgi:hypothetical protein